MKFSDLAQAIPDAYAMWKDMESHAPGMRMGYMQIGDEERGERQESVPATVDHYELRRL